MESEDSILTTISASNYGTENSLSSFNSSAINVVSPMHLPQQPKTKKTCEKRLNAKLVCAIDLGSVKIPKTLWETKFYDSKNDAKLSHSKSDNTLLFEPVTKILSSKCPLQMFDMKVLKKKVVIRCYCYFPRCISYNLIFVKGNTEKNADPDFVVLQIFSSGKKVDHIHGGASGGKREKGGEVRKQLIEIAKSKLPQELKTMDRIASDASLLLANNMDRAGTTTTYTNIRREALAVDDRHKDEIKALELLHDEMEKKDPNNNWIAQVSCAIQLLFETD